MMSALRVCLVATALTTFLATAQAYDICAFPCVQKIYSDNCDGAICVFGYTAVDQPANVCSDTCLDAIAGDEMLSCLQQNDPDREDFDEVIATKVEEVANYCANLPGVEAVAPVMPPEVEPAMPPAVKPVLPPEVESIPQATHPYDICDFRCVNKIYEEKCDGAFCVFGYNTVAQRRNICKDTCLDALASDEMLLCLKKNDVKRKDFDAVLETILGEITDYCSSLPNHPEPPMPMVDPPMPMVDPPGPMPMDSDDLEEPIAKSPMMMVDPPLPIPESPFDSIDLEEPAAKPPMMVDPLLPIAKSPGLSFDSVDLEEPIA